MSVRAIDCIIIGAGVVGLTLAREFKQRHPDASILILEKEPEVGRHSSGRNSGVVHSGIYYPKGSLKAKICAKGARQLKAYCRENELPLNALGKVVVPLKAGDEQQLALLLDRAQSNGARAELIDRQTLAEYEPQVSSITDTALWVPDTSVIDPKAVLRQLVSDNERSGITLQYNTCIEKINTQKRELRVSGQVLSYGHVYNTAGLYADVLARSFGLQDRYTILPFKGIYYRLSPDAPVKVNHLIYPVPDLNVPFLGVHFTTLITGETVLGPTAVPAWGRENYRYLKGLRPVEAWQIIRKLGQQYWLNQQGFRSFTHAEALRYFKGRFTQAAQIMVPALRRQHLLRSAKVGIRAQLLDCEKKELVMDFLVEHGPHSTHILNAVSPAFTCSFAFAKYVLDSQPTV